MRRLIRFLVVLGLAAAAGLAGLWWMASPRTPGPFYVVTEALPEVPGRLLRSAPMTGGLPQDARAWRILYSTTRPDGTVAAASGAVAVPAGAEGPLPVIAYAHAATGVATGCAPSLGDAPFAAIPGVARLLEEGWAVVATDYTGLGTPGPHLYLVGEDAGRAVLDSIRAARALPEAMLAGRAVVWGHGQGGHAALWAGQIAPDYAPDAGIAGVAAVSPMSDLPALVGQTRDGAEARILSAYAVAGYAAAYPAADPWSYTDPWMRPLIRDIAGRCLDMPAALLSVAETRLLPDDGIFGHDPANGAFGERLDENVPRGPFAMPVLIGQGSADDLVPEPVQRGYADALCAANAPVTYRALSGHDHDSIVQPESPMMLDLFDWSRARFAGEAAPPCR